MKKGQILLVIVDYSLSAERIPISIAKEGHILLGKVNEQKPGSFLIQLILEAKRNEIIKVFSEGSPNTKTEVVNILKEIDPANGSRYQQILSH